MQMTKLFATLGLLIAGSAFAAPGTAYTDASSWTGIGISSSSRSKGVQGDALEKALTRCREDGFRNCNYKIANITSTEVIGSFGNERVEASAVVLGTDQGTHRSIFSATWRSAIGSYAL